MQAHIRREGRGVRPVLRDGEDAAKPATMRVAGVAVGQRVVAHREEHAATGAGDLAEVVVQHAQAGRHELLKVEPHRGLLELLRVRIEPHHVGPAALDAPIDSALVVGINLALLAQIAVTGPEHVRAAGGLLVGDVDLELVGVEHDVFVAATGGPGRLHGHFEQELLPALDARPGVNRLLACEVNAGPRGVLGKRRLPPDHRAADERQVHARGDGEGDVALRHEPRGRGQGDRAQLARLGERDLRAGLRGLEQLRARLDVGEGFSWGEAAGRGHLPDGGDDLLQRHRAGRVLHRHRDAVALAGRAQVNDHGPLQGGLQQVNQQRLPGCRWLEFHRGGQLGVALAEQVQPVELHDEFVPRAIHRHLLRCGQSGCQQQQWEQVDQADELHAVSVPAETPFRQ